MQLTLYKKMLVVYNKMKIKYSIIIYYYYFLRLLTKILFTHIYNYNSLVFTQTKYIKMMIKI
jgi:hypothetical protein